LKIEKWNDRTRRIMTSQAPEPGDDRSGSRHTTGRKAWQTWAAGLREEITMSHADLPVLACCAVSGLCDSVAFNAGGVFVSMQTGQRKELPLVRRCLTACRAGNTIFLALGAAGLPAGEPLLWLKAFVSIAAFWVGCFAFSKSRHLHPLRKATLSMAFLVQAAFVFAAAALSQARVVPAFAAQLLGKADSAELAEHHGDKIIMLPLALLAFQFGGQIVASRVLGINEVPTNVLISLYCDLLSDPKLFAPLGSNPKRNRRFAAVVLLIGGGIAGGWIQRTHAGMSAVLWLAGFIKLVIALAWLWWSPKGGNGPEKGTP